MLYVLHLSGELIYFLLEIEVDKSSKWGFSTLCFEAPSSEGSYGGCFL